MMIYADYNGSAPLLEEVRLYLRDRLEKGPYGNPNAIHSLGMKILAGMEKCRQICAKELGASAHQVFFTSGSSEGISTVFHSILQNNINHQQKNIIVLSSLEHSAVINAAKYYEAQGFQLYFVPSLKNGEIDLADFKSFVEKNSKQITLVSIMAANNETGVIQPYREVGQICRDHQILYFSDTTQFIGKIPFDFSQLPFDFAVCSGHKLGALTGTGLLLARDPRLLKPLIWGGGQEKGLRGGTQNYIGSETVAIALMEFNKNISLLNEVKKYREEFEQKIKNDFPQVVIMGEKAQRLSGTTMISYPGIHGQAVQIELEAQNIFVTTSSACSDNDPTPSKVLSSMGYADDIGRGVIRISVGLKNAEENYQKIYQALKYAYQKLSQVKF